MISQRFLAFGRMLQRMLGLPCMVWAALVGRVLIGAVDIHRKLRAHRRRARIAALKRDGTEHGA